MLNSQISIRYPNIIIVANMHMHIHNKNLSYRKETIILLCGSVSAKCYRETIFYRYYRCIFNYFDVIGTQS